MPWRGPSYPGEFPTLGYLALDWIVENLAAPDRTEYEPFLPTREQAEFVLRFYEIDPATGRRRRRRGLIGRARGWGKSPFLAAIAACEALGEVVPAGWDADGEPVGMPWARVRTPLVQFAAVSEEQTKNSWDPLLEMLEGPVVDNYPGLEPLATFVNLPRGRMEPITAAARTVKGNRPVFAVLDQTEEWVKSNGGVRLAQVIRTNAAKIGGSTIESPNAFIPGQNSVAESSAMYARRIAEGRARDDGLLYDHREAPETNERVRESLVAGLRYAYGDSSDHPDGCVIHDPPCPPGWADIERRVGEFWDQSNDPQILRIDYLNQITHAIDSWVSQPEWAARYNREPKLADGDLITLGFDGSQGRVEGVADATALIGCRVADGYEFVIEIWEQPETWTPPADAPDAHWTPPEYQVDGAVARTFAQYNVVAFYLDATGWEEHAAKWEAKYGDRLKVKASGSSKVRWPKNQMSRVVPALKAMRTAIRTGELSHDGDSTFARHVLNARKRDTRGGYFIAKENPSSPNKIDAAYAGLLAWQARLDVIAGGFDKVQETFVPYRIR